MKQEILNTIDDAVSDFLYNDRKEDEHLNKSWEKAIKSGDITYGEIVERFKEQLLKGIDI